MDVGNMTYKAFESQPTRIDENDEVVELKTPETAVRTPSNSILYVIDQWAQQGSSTETPKEYSTMLVDDSYDAVPTILLQTPKDGYGHFSLYLTSPDGQTENLLWPGYRAVYRHGRFLSAEDLLGNSQFDP